MASKSRSSIWPVVTIIVAVLCLIIAIPDTYKAGLPGFLKPGLHLGLDLAGGTQLDFRISEDEINAREKKVQDEIATLKAQKKDEDVLRKQVELQSIQEQHSNLVEAIRAVLERRVNSLGVSEATITPSYFGSEKHLLVECPGVIDVNRCIATVGKTIQLEFKEEFSGPSDDYVKGVREKAARIDALLKTTTGSLQTIGQDLSSELAVTYTDSTPVYENQLPPILKPLWTKKKGEPIFRVEGSVQSVVQNAQGQPEVKELKGIYYAQVLEDKKPTEREITDASEAMPLLAKKLSGSVLSQKNAVDISTLPANVQKVLTAGTIGSLATVDLGSSEFGLLNLRGRIDGEPEMPTSHILVAFKGAPQAAATVTRSKEEAKARAEALKKRLNAGEDFTTLAKTESDATSKAQGGSLGVLRKGTMPAPAFATAALALTKKGQISDVVETSFGFHIIRADDVQRMSPTTATYELLATKGLNAKSTVDGWKKQIDDKKVTSVEDQMVVRILSLSLEPTGWRDTALNGQRFRSAAVTTDQVTNVPMVQIQFDEEGAKLFQQLTKANIGKRIAIFVGGDLVSAPNVQTEIVGGTAVITGSRDFEEARKLAQDLNTGAIPAPIYLAGQSTVEATLGTSALHQSIIAAMVGLALLCLFMISIYRLLGVMAAIALLFYVLLLIASTKLPILLISNQYVVLTLAGIAGMILSMGMAVDANVLAFERIKEELRKGKSLKTAVDSGFKRAWPSVRDGNMSTLITCAILFVIGTSIIRGFAITLAIGLFLSLFTSIIVSRWLCRQIAMSAFAERHHLFGIKTEEVRGHHQS
ncbi:MAG: protein translocase subunit SecD [Candidatus Peribacteraceae bacterium]|nr:protein translocase subunit SecD [Candidatus Peribacteraceae bacterium]